MNYAILGSGAWGTALAIHFHRLGHTTTLAARRLEAAERIASDRVNADYLPEISIPADLQIGHEVKPAILEADAVVIATPVKGLREACRQVAEARDTSWNLRAVVAVCKGLEPEELRLPSEVLREAFPDLAIGMLSGPTNALELARGQPAAATLAIEGDPGARDELQAAWSNEVFRLYASDDLTGVALGGSLKNVYAIASGVCDGLGLGDNAKAALLTRSLREMVDLGVGLGGRQGTFLGLSGFGDLVATSYGSWSRNRSFGEALGRGLTPEEATEGRPFAVEGRHSAGLFVRRCDGLGLSAPILREVHAVVHGGKSPRRAMGDLMGRELRDE